MQISRGERDTFQEVNENHIMERVDRLCFLIAIFFGALRTASAAPLPPFQQIEFERYGADSHYFVVMPGQDDGLSGYQIKVARNPQRSVFGSVRLPIEHPICKRLDLLFQRQIKVRQRKLDRRPASTWLTVKTKSKNGQKLYHRAFLGKEDAQLFDDLESLVRTSQQ